MGKIKRYRIIATRTPLFGGNTSTYKSEGTLEELIKYHSYTLEVGKSWEREKGNKKINMNPRNIQSLCDNLYNAKSNAAKNGYSGYYYDWEEITENEKLQENIKAKLVKESLEENLNESFKSKAAEEFVLLLKNITRNKELPYHINRMDWSRFDGEILKLSPEEAKVYRTNLSKLVVWVATSRKTYKWKEPRWTRYGQKQDRSLYINPSIIGFTVGKNQVSTTYDLGDEIKIAQNAYDKPMVNTYKGLSEFADYAFVFDIEELKKYSSKDLRQSRAKNKESALALKDPKQILDDNKNRYRIALNKLKSDKIGAELKNEISVITDYLEKEIRKNLTYNLIKDETGKLNLDNNLNMNLIYNQITAHNRLLDKLEKYIKEINDWGINHNWAEYALNALKSEMTNTIEKFNIKLNESFKSKAEMGKKLNKFAKQMIEAGMPMKAVSALTDIYLDQEFRGVVEIKIKADPYVEGTFALRIVKKRGVLDLLWNKGYYDEVEFESWPPTASPDNLQFF